MLSLARPLARTSGLCLAQPARLSRRFPTSPVLRSFSMSASSAQKHNPWAEQLPKPADQLNSYLASLPDFAEGSKRMSIRPKHLEHAAEGFKLGWIVQAGATFADDSRTQMTGSWFLLREESLEKARARLAQDVYATDGAWDMSRATITPVAIAKH
ncbi:hypothetical protein BMF94_3069 [Rhodotorula taiwanensis]|uniref:YCII-related domain-containing protein n=1 Tax=Rhodotorula taiwanensis TaxID=741276 RepID=A0A2S5BAW2_9BASI|nr:hypothetical protein BMF94_3069 [Rhodotorula taiwanensis]